MTASFAQLGGDSLQSVQFSVAINEITRAREQAPLPIPYLLNQPLGNIVRRLNGERPASDVTQWQRDREDVLTELLNVESSVRVGERSQ